MTITIYNRNELYNIPLEAIIYLKAEDHYTAAYYHNGSRVLVPVGLSRLAHIIASHTDFDALFIHAGRSYIIGRKHISFINVMKETISFFAIDGKLLTITLPKARLRALMVAMNCGAGADAGPGYVLKATQDVGGG